MQRPTLLTIAGFDPSSGAGVTADLAVFAAHDLFGTSCITALTVQSTLGVAAIYPVSAEIVNETLEHLDADLPPAGVKIGMLGTKLCVDAVVRYLRRLRARERRVMVVLDPVLRSSSGRVLLEQEGLEALKAELLPLVDWVTPNLDELPVLSGVELEPGRGRQALVRSAAALAQAHPELTVLAKGGHAEPPDDLLLAPGGAAEPVWLTGERVVTSSTHGTGCAFSSALLCRLVHGDGSVESATAAKRYVGEALRRAQPIGHGYGPMNLLWPLTADVGTIA